MEKRDLALHRLSLDHSLAVRVLRSEGMSEEYFDTNVPCPLCGGNDRFQFKNKEGSGNYFCRHCGGGNVFTLLMKFAGMNFPEALDRVITFDGGSYDAGAIGKPIPARVGGKVPKTAEEISAIRAKHKKLWSEGRAIQEGDPVWKYLSSRIPNLTLNDISPVLRFHPKLEYWIKTKPEENNGKEVKLLGTFPGMIAYVTAPDGMSQDIHRTFLTENGQKADVPEVKKTYKSIDVFGGAVRLVKPTGNLLAVAEGIESSIAALMFRNVPCWSVLNAWNMEQFVIPEQTKILHIFADPDLPDPRTGKRKGIESARALQRKAQSMGKKAQIHYPSKPGMDILDLLVEINGH